MAGIAKLRCHHLVYLALIPVLTVDVRWQLSSSSRVAWLKELGATADHFKQKSAGAHSHSRSQ